MEKFPKLISMFERGEVSITTISAVASALESRENKEEQEEILSILPYASARRIEQVKAETKPKNSVKEYVKPVAVKKKQRVELSLFESVQEQANHSDVGVNNIKELEQRFEVKFSMSEDCMGKYEEVKLLLSNKLGGNAELEKLFEVLLDEYLQKHSPKKKEERRLARKARQRKPQEAACVAKGERKRSRHIPAAIKNRVYLRDGGRCTFIGEDGQRCEERRHLEYDHRVPFALGGDNSAENLRLVCRCHNRLLAERVYGEGYMRQFNRTAPL